MSHDAALDFWQALMQDKELNSILSDILGEQQGTAQQNALVAFAVERGYDFSFAELKAVMSAPEPTNGEIATLMGLPEAEIWACRLRKNA
tara:strand:- start:201 stop:470 length:270 start_codon:yes stop_codon:yes gene_type:complete